MITQEDVENVRKLAIYLKTPRTVSEMAEYLHVPRMRAMDYLEVILRQPKVYTCTCADVAGVEKRWQIS